MQKQIAIVGFAYRLPGTDRTLFWGDLTAGHDLVSRVPEDRWAQETFLHPNRKAPGASYTFAAGTIGEVTGFDAAFFGISPREAEQMDPQQRLLLELTWEAFEHAGIRPSDARGSRASVYIGFSGSDHSYRLADDPASMDASTMTGNTASIAANRLSYWFDLRGPSMAVDTACSSSMVAFHQACQSLRAGESDMAVTGGVSMHLHPFAFIGFAKASMLSPRGICGVFDADADGYVRAEGGGIFLLKPLDAALADGNRIWALVAGSGVNCDGKTNGLTVPSWERQAALLQEIYAEAGIAADEVDYLEAHGTGTAVGDPIETRALGAALGEARDETNPLLIGSVKSNVGHLEAASAIAGLVKAIACLEHRAVPPTIHLKALNPYIEADEWNLRVVTENTPLDPDKKLVVGVNSFGFGGANAHVVLQSADHLKDDSVTGQPKSQRSPAPLLLSARSPQALRAVAGQFADLLQDASAEHAYDIAYSAYLTREHHDQRAMLHGLEPEAAVAALEAFAAGKPAAGLFEGDAIPDASRPVFVYSGNGSQWAGMGRQLLLESDEFARIMSDLDAVFARHVDFGLLDNLQREDLGEAMAFTEIAQPLLFGLQVGLTELLKGLGLHPAAVIGHSVGEVAAAWACAALTLDQAVKVILERSTQQAKTKGDGAMLAVGMGEAGIKALLEELPDAKQLAIAGINSPRGVTIAGPVAVLEKLELQLAEREVFFRRLALDYAFHSPSMDPLQKPLEQGLAGLQAERGEIPFYSTVTGGRLRGERLGARYWWRNIREPVQFAEATDALIEDGFNLFVEIGPHAVLRNYINEGLRNAQVAGRVIPTLAREDDRLLRVHEAFCQAVIAGTPVDTASLFPYRGRNVELPCYPWQRETFWLPQTPEGYGLINRRKVHPLLGYRLHENAGQWENQVDTGLIPALADHVVGDTVVFPAAAYVELALAAAAAWRPADSYEIEELEIRAPLVLDEEIGKRVRLVIDESDGRFRISSRERLSEDPWLLHAEGRILGAVSDTRPDAHRVLPTRDADATGVEHYALTERVGLNYGKAFQAVDAIWRCEDLVVARLQPVPDSFSDCQLDPGVLDGAFQLLVDLFVEEIGEHGGIAFVPVKVGRLQLYRPGTEVHLAEARLLRRSPRSVLCAFTLYDAEGQPVAAVEQVRFRGVMLRRPVADHTGYLRYQLVPQPNAGMGPAAGLPPVEKCAAFCEARLHDPQRTVLRRRYYDEVEPLLDALCASFARELLADLVPPDQLVIPEKLVASGSVAPAQDRFLRRMLAMLQEDGLMEATEEGWRWSSEAELPAPADIWISLLGDYPDFSAEALMAGRAGMHLREALADSAAADEPGAQGCDNATLAHYLGASPSITETSRVIADLVQMIMAELPAGRRLRILELTSCRSQLSPHVLPHVDLNRSDYLIGVSAPELIDEFEPLQSRFPEIDIREMDFMRGAGAAPNEPHQVFDLILFANELAEAENPEVLLANISALMASEGQLVVVEQRSSRWADLAFGRQTRWWLADAEGSLASRQRPPRSWLPLMRRNGLTDVQVVQDLPDVVSGPYLMLAGKAGLLADTPSVETTPAPGLWILVRDDDGYSGVLAKVVESQLQAAGHQVVVATAGGGFGTPGPDVFEIDVADSEDFERLIRTVRRLHGEASAIVLLNGLQAGDVPVGEGEVLEQTMRRCRSLLAVLHACSASEATPDLVLVGANASSAERILDDQPVCPVEDAGADAALWGMARTAINEYPDIRLRLIELAECDAVKAMAEGLVQEILQPDEEDELLLTSVGRYVPRLRDLEAPISGADDKTADSDGVELLSRLDFSQPGPLKNLHWRQLPVPDLPAGYLEISVRAAGLNFRDVMYAMGLLSDEALEQGFAGPHLGMELAGVVTRLGAGVEGFEPGDEVVAFAPSSFATLTQTPASAVVRKPPEWSFEAAATVPTTFFTVYYALHHLARLAAGERVLIHGAAGGVGVAAIQFAKYLGAEIFATAGSEEKRDFVRLLGADHVMDSRSLDFADEVLALTDGEGVDVVLNSLAGEAINRNLRVLRPFGRFLELGKRDFYENTRIGLRPFRNNITYFGIDADQLMSERPGLTQRLFNELMGLFDQGVLKPLPYRAFAAADAVDAFRYMQQSRQIGKVVLSFRDGVPHDIAAGDQGGKLALSTDGTYLVSGGLSGFGLQTAVWLASKGARHLVLLSRRGQASADEQPILDELERQGVDVHALACDVTDRGALAAALDYIEEDLPPLRGVVHAAMVIDDGLLRNLTAPRLEKVLAPKILGARHLDELTRDHQLDFFVLYSSATTVFGNPGQGNYVAANSYLEALAETRRANGLPALCVAWGAIGDVGYLARHEEIKEALVGRMGGRALDADDALAILERLILADASGLAVLDLDWNAMRRYLPSAVAPKYSALARRMEVSEGDGDMAAELQRWVAELSPEELHEALVDLLKREVGEILRIAPERLDENRSLYDLGMDSLMGLELVSAVEARFGIVLPIMALSEGLTINKLVERLIRQLKGGAETAEEGMVSRVADTGAAHSRNIVAEVGEDRASQVAEDVAAAVSAEKPSDHSLLRRS